MIHMGHDWVTPPKEKDRNHIVIFSVKFLGLKYQAHILLTRLLKSNTTSTTKPVHW